MNPFQTIQPADYRQIMTDECSTLSNCVVNFPPGFEPRNIDVIVGKGMRNFAHAGNEIFRRIVASRNEEYNTSRSRKVRSKIISSIVSHIRSTGGYFVKKDPGTGLWMEADEVLARDKTSQAFRNLSKNKSRKSNSSSLPYPLQRNEGILPNVQVSRDVNPSQLTMEYKSTTSADTIDDIIEKMSSSLPQYFHEDMNDFEPVPIAEALKFEADDADTFTTATASLGGSASSFNNNYESDVPMQCDIREQNSTVFVIDPLPLSPLTNQNDSINQFNYSTVCHNGSETKNITL